MSPITVQAARLASRQALRAPLRQQVFRRYASSNATVERAPADWGRIVKSRAGILAIYFPGMALALGWPLVAAKMMGA
ncbi:hypothetical protein F4801DRAFT_581519 [Xylaria longipes]|nr:hypothetical protein F4801DRAFT_581519 [Xylaria longipes]RYC66185.1 hypothetical protein CHU98_g93 [Xylaria longipes]